MHETDGYPVPEALERFCEGLRPLEAIDCELLDAVYAVLAQPAVSERDVPDSPRSAVDGYALRANDVRGAAQGSPVRLRLVGSALAGHPEEGSVGAGDAVRITTGGVVPHGADAVQYQEVCMAGDGWVDVGEPVAAGDNMRPAGEDFRRGQELLSAGERLTPERIGLLTAMGVPHVRIVRRPRVRFVSTGDEIYSLGDELPPGGTYDSNSRQITAALSALGAEVERVGPIEDRTEALIEACSGQWDMLLTSGGVSVGPADRIEGVASRMGAEVRFHWAKMRPGAPTMGLNLGGRPWLGLSGNPLSAQVGFDLFGRAALSVLSGGAPTVRRGRVRLMEDFRRRGPDAPRYLRARIDWEEGELRARVHAYQSSGGLRAMAQTNGYVIQPAGVSDLPAGSMLDALLVLPLWG
ncbi:MAG: molybdopterin molybdotransferase MoeA [Thermaerobacter sp.]|nr:molybdopterin molybdotransferase MoeA [Thermaerobacter sp.]